MYAETLFGRQTTGKLVREIHPIFTQSLFEHADSENENFPLSIFMIVSPMAPLIINVFF